MAKDRYAKSKRDNLSWLFRFIALVIVLLCVFKFLIGISFVDGVSMQNTLVDGDFLLYTRIGSSYERGDIVAATLPDGKHYVKRVIAVEGDVITLVDGCFYVNGEKEGTPYAIGETRAEDVVLSYPYTVGEGRVFIVGDNRLSSTDSRRYGAILKEDVQGKVIFRAGKSGFGGID